MRGLKPGRISDLRSWRWMGDAYGNLNSYNCDSPRRHRAFASRSMLKKAARAARQSDRARQRCVRRRPRAGIGDAIRQRCERHRRPDGVCWTDGLRAYASGVSVPYILNYSPMRRARRRKVWATHLAAQDWYRGRALHGRAHQRGAGFDLKADPARTAGSRGWPNRCETRGAVEERLEALSGTR